jgi:hypothetical protein
LGTQDANVKVQLYKGTTKKLDITLSAPNSGTYDWLIPSTLANGVYSVRITTLDNKVKGKSAQFSIATGRIAVTQPAAGTIWQRGLPHIITWTSEGAVNANVKIQLFKGTALVSTLTANTANDGSFEWTIPANQALAANYKLRIIALDNQVQGDSGRFAIAASVGLALASPNGNEMLKAAEPHVIRWTDDPNVLEVKLEYSHDNGVTYATIADHVADTGNYEWLAPVNFMRNGIVRISDSSGKPWMNDGLLEVGFKFSYAGAGDEPGAILWFGGSDPRDPGFGFARLGIGRSQVEFGGIGRAIESLEGGWHELRVRFDFRRDTAVIFIDEQLLFENAALHTTRERYFQPNLTLQIGGDNQAELVMDDLAINVVSLNDAGEDKESFVVLRDNFDRYDERANALGNCWQSRAVNSEANKIDLDSDAAAGKALMVKSEAGKKLLIWLPFSLPDKVPFDISDRNFTIVP